eukprot:11591258-Alexandrium_andersonii.AAC.1
MVRTNALLGKFTAAGAVSPVTPKALASPEKPKEDKPKEEPQEVKPLQDGGASAAAASASSSAPPAALVDGEAGAGADGEKKEASGEKKGEETPA